MLCGPGDAGGHRHYADEVRRQQGLPIHIRVGLNSGEVVVRAIGNDLHMDYTAVGQTTHLAARMEQHGLPGSTLITPAPWGWSRASWRSRRWGRARQGLTDPLEVYEVRGAELVWSRLQAAVARGLTRFVGRQPELAALHQALERAGAGHGQVVACSARPGSGSHGWSTRLATPTARRAGGYSPAPGVLRQGHPVFPCR